MIKPQSAPLFKRLLKLTEQIEVQGVLFTIPDCEAMIALKFASMTSAGRSVEDKYTDARDFILMVKSGGGLSEAKLSELGELAYDGGGKDVLKLAVDARAGRMLDIGGRHDPADCASIPESED